MKSLPFHVSIHADGSLIGQIAQSLQAAVHTGHFQPGERLPTLEAMSAELGVGMNTMRSAVARLVAQNVVDVRPGAGIRVRATHEPRFRAHIVQVTHALPSSYYYAMRNHAFLECLRGHDILATVVCLNERESQLGFPTLKHILATQPVTLAVLDGESLGYNSRIRKILDERGVRFVQKWVRKPAAAALDSLFLEIGPAFRQLARHLARCGIERVHFFSSMDEAWHSFRDAAKALGLAVQCTAINQTCRDATGEIGVEREGHSTIARLLKQRRIERGRAVLVITDDYFARGAMTALLEAGWVFPRDIQLATLVNDGHAPVADTPLTRVVMYPARDGEAMAQVVMRSLVPHKRRRKPLVVRPRFVAGKSTRLTEKKPNRT